MANIYLNPLDHLMSQTGHEMVRYADDMVILCPSAEAAETVLNSLREWSAQAGLKLHPEKTKIDSLRSAVDMGQPKAHFDFLGYRFWRGKTSGGIRRYIRPKSKKKLKESLKPLTKRANGNSLAGIAKKPQPKLRGFYGYFKHVSAGALNDVDEWIRSRLRSILRKRAGLRGRDQQRWPNRYFDEQGLLNLERARKLELMSLRQADNF